MDERLVNLIGKDRTLTKTFDFPRFKKEINLTQYAAYLGYEIDRKKSTRNSIAMRQGNADKVIISKQYGVWVYFSVYDDQDNGTIVDFVKNRTSKHLFEIGEELHLWLGGSIELPKPKSYVQDVEEKKADPERVKRVFNCCSPAFEHDYLKSRGISAEVLMSPRFSGRVFQDRYLNAVFPHFKDKKVCGLELKGEDTGLFVRGSEKTLWRSNITAQDDTLIISETAIDAISYQILYPLSSAFYTATSGGFSPEQGDIVRQLLTSLPQIRKIIRIMDNDNGGDVLADRLDTIINETDYQGLNNRHSPDICGLDWNDVLKKQLGI